MASPIEEAQNFYNKHGRMFTPNLQRCLETGWVVSTKSIFAMGKCYEKNGKTVCFIDFMCGDLSKFISIDEEYCIDIVEFNRNFSEKVKTYNAKRMRRLIYGK